LISGERKREKVRGEPRNVCANGTRGRGTDHLENALLAMGSRVAGWSITSKNGNNKKEPYGDDNEKGTRD